MKNVFTFSKEMYKNDENNLQLFPDFKYFNFIFKYKRSLQNFQVQQPYNHAIYFMQTLLVEKGWTKEELLCSIDDFSYEDIQDFIPKFLTQGVFIESLIFGNISKEVNDIKLFTLDIFVA